jgi:hypothetical protein
MKSRMNDLDLLSWVARHPAGDTGRGVLRARQVAETHCGIAMLRLQNPFYESSP